MGQRANLVIVENGGYSLFYSHWRASTLDRDLFWGPHYAEAFIRAQERVDDAGWLNDIWAEGGVVLDQQAKVLLFFGGEDIYFEAPLRRVYLRLMRIVWTGWNVRWAYEGIADIAEYVGLSRQKVLAPHDPLCFALSQLRISEKILGGIVTVRWSDRDVRCYALVPRAQDLVCAGPALIDRLRELPAPTRLDAGDLTRGFPHGGVHIDVVARRLEFWIGAPQPDILRRARTHWNDWTLVWHQDRYESQAALTDGALAFPAPTRDELLQRLRHILMMAVGSSGPDLLLRSLQATQRVGERVTHVNPAALKDAQLELPITEREAVLASAIATLEREGNLRPR
jgi:hypothetical protein